MTTTDVQTQMEEIAQVLVLLDPEDTGSVATIGNQLQEMARNLRESGRDTEAMAAENAAGLTADCVKNGAMAPAVVDALTRAIESLQEILENPPVMDNDTPVETLDTEVAAVETTNEAEDPASDEPVSAPAIEGLTLSQMVDDNIVSEFLSRQSDSLGDQEKLILSFEQGVDEDALEEFKRWFHTLKGESALLDLTTMAELCHVTEDMIQAEDPQACVDRLLEVMDWLQACFSYLMEQGPAPETIDNLKAKLQSPAPAVEAEEAVSEVPEATESPEAEVVDEIVAATEVEAVVDEEPVAEATPEPPAAVALPVVELPDYGSKNLLEGDVGLLQDFIGEAVEHLDASEGHLLTIEADPHEIEALNAVFRGFHTIKGLAGFAELDHIQELAHKAENLLDMGRKGELELSGNNMDLVFESVDMMKRLVEGLVEAMASSGYPAEVDDLPNLVARLMVSTEHPGEAVAAAAPPPTPEPTPESEVTASDDAAPKSGFVPLANMKKKATPPPADDAKPKSGFVPLANMKKKETPAPAATQAPQAAAPKAAAPKPPAPKAAAKAAPSAGAVKVKEAMRVDAERLDHLIETIGELVIAESMVSQNPEIRQNMSVKLAKDLDHLDKISRELQEIGMSLRMVPVRPVFQKMARLVRDLAKKTGRKVDFVMTGEDTELDKNVVDKIGDPLVHMIRNAVDHGLEPNAEDREAAGKSPTGRIELRAFHKGGNICIEIVDDGRGLPRDKILRKAYDRGLLREGEVPSDRDINNLIFEPGFSTAKEVTDISGRGVGMDVVRRNIEELRGTCEINSEPGKGSVFSIKLPLTLAIIEGMVISCGTEHYIVPTLSVVRLVRPTTKDISMVFDRGEMLAFEDVHLPLFRLSKLFNVETNKHDPAEAVIVVVEDEGRKIGLLADDLLGQQSIVIKSLGESMQDTDGVAGGAIMSNGNVALILDVAGLTRVAHTNDTAIVAEESAPESVSE